MKVLRKVAKEDRNAHSLASWQRRWFRNAAYTASSSSARFTQLCATTNPSPLSAYRLSTEMYSSYGCHTVFASVWYGELGESMWYRANSTHSASQMTMIVEIGRASCRERV